MNVFSSLSHLGNSELINNIITSSSLSKRKRKKEKSVDASFEHTSLHQVVIGHNTVNGPGIPKAPVKAGRVNDGFAVATNKKSLRLAGKPTTLHCL